MNNNQYFHHVVLQLLNHTRQQEQLEKLRLDMAMGDEIDISERGNAAKKTAGK